MTAAPIIAYVKENHIHLRSLQAFYSMYKNDGVLKLLINSQATLKRSLFTDQGREPKTVTRVSSPLQTGRYIVVGQSLTFTLKTHGKSN